ncbi:Predicted Zn-dependent peptidase [Vibrio xiamenensis]|uniref:Predicted Zn-dependent peptidase n=1 Tax=Vibrio xiamenensis TaxID=861298 RepID=A0A1G8A459_9VIBR|nr:pitrilysin family protein [Vibrio xiamenensis]SDH15742.1 Predicted Zn-dependent peptidase [Vibrio xiamenensis]
MRYLLLAFAALLFGCSQLSDQTSIQADSHWQSKTLANGLRYHVYPTDDEAVSVRLIVHAGSLQESDEQRGYAHFLEHMAFEGSERVTKAQLYTLLGEQNAKLDADSHAYTSYRETVYKVDLPTTAKLNDALWWLSDVAFRQQFLPASIKASKQQVLSEIKQGHPDVGSFIDNVYQFMLGDTALMTRDPYGSKASISTVSKTQLQGFYHRWYQPQNAELVITGQVQIAHIDTLVKQMFGNWQAEAAHDSAPKTDYPVKLDDYVTQVHTHELPSMLLVAKRGKTTIDTLGAQTELRLERLAYSAINQRLNAVFNQTDLSAQSIYAFDSELESHRYSFIGIEFKPQDRISSQALFLNTLAKLRDVGMSDNEFQTALAYYQELLDDSDHDWAQQLPMDYAEQKVTSLVENTTLQSQQQFSQSLQRFLDNVSIDQANAKLRQVLSQPYVMMLGAGAKENRSALQAKIASWKAQYDGKTP